MVPDGMVPDGPVPNGGAPRAGRPAPSGGGVTPAGGGVPLFRKSIFRTECDECHETFPVNTGGVCERCRRILCGTHLHGSLVRRVAIAFGAPNVCVRCRREVAAGRQ